MSERSHVRLVRPTLLTWVAAAATLSAISFTVVFLVVGYPSLPSLLPVHFNHAGRANGWQYKTYARVMMPGFVQMALTLIFGLIGALLLSRSHTAGEKDAPDIVAASTATEAIALVAFIWVGVQAYGAIALLMMWQSSEAGLGAPYTLVTVGGIVMTLIVGFRAKTRLGRPLPREFVPKHWRFGHLYRNPMDPALFVPTRDGSRWTLNFGRPVAAALLGTVLIAGIVGPTAILTLLLR